MHTEPKEDLKRTPPSQEKKQILDASEPSVAYRLARHEVDEELNAVAVLGYN